MAPGSYLNDYSTLKIRSDARLHRMRKVQAFREKYRDPEAFDFVKIFAGTSDESANGISADSMFVPFSRSVNYLRGRRGSR